jgi:hypothetical protein
VQPVVHNGEAYRLAPILGLTAATCATQDRTPPDSRPRTLDSELRTAFHYNSQIETKSSQELSKPKLQTTYTELRLPSASPPPLGERPVLSGVEKARVKGF